MTKIAIKPESTSIEPILSPALARIEAVAQLCADDRASLQALLGNRIKIRRGGDFIKDGKPVSAMFVIEEGWAIRYAITSEGKRQVMNVALPGDLVGYHCALIGRAHFNASALNDTVLASIDPASFLDLVSTRPGLGAGLSRLAASELAGLRVQTVRLGRLSAEQRIAHFLSETWHRALRVGLVRNGWVSMPMTQTDISDTLGLSLVHTNRQLQALKRNGLIQLRRDRLRILDVDALAILGDYHPLPV